jgi:hypothetical protein
VDRLFVTKTLLDGVELAKTRKAMGELAITVGELAITVGELAKTVAGVVKGLEGRRALSPVLRRFASN